MCKNRSILTQTLLTIAIPLVAAFLLVLVLGTDVLRKGGESFAREIVGNVAEQISIRIEDRLAVMYTALNLTRRSLEALDASDSPAAAEAATRIVRDTLLSAEGVYGSWVVFEPEAFATDGRFVASFVKSGRYVRAVDHITPAMLDDPEQSPWYDFPLRSGGNYFVTAERHDYGTGDGPVYRGTLAFPITRDGTVVGCVGIDVLYRQLLNFLVDQEILGAPRAMALIGETGEVIHATDAGPRPILAAPDDVAAALDARHPVLRYASSRAGAGKVLICLAPIAMARSSLRTLLYIELPSSALTARSLPLVRRLSWVIVGCFVLLGAAICVVVGGIVRPVKALTRNADAIARGDLGVDFGDGDGGGDDKPSGNELERLRLALKKMVRQLGEVHQLKLGAVEAEMERKRMAEANAAKSRFFATMSHEIRTPMNAISGLSEILLAGELDDWARRYVQDIRISAASLLRIINDILDTSRMEEGKFALRKDHFNLAAMLANVDSVVALMARQKGLEYHSNLDHAPQYCYGDAERLRQILLNLLSNAVKYTARGKVAFTAALAGDAVRFTVADTGQGIAAGDLPYVFDPYRRAESAVAGIEGAGLGLNITRQLVELMGGSVSVRSTLGKGSVFRAEIPYEPGDATHAPLAGSAPAAAAPSAPRSAAVLVVDDNAVNLSVACGFLRMAGVEADTAASGEEAVAAASARDYDLVFMDHMMPGMDGVEATRRIRALGGRNAAVPVVALTANVMGSIREDLLRDGMDDFLAKPVALPELKRMLARWLDGGRGGARHG